MKWNSYPHTYFRLPAQNLPKQPLRGAEAVQEGPQTKHQPLQTDRPYPTQKAARKFICICIRFTYYILIGLEEGPVARAVFSHVGKTNIAILCNCVVGRRLLLNFAQFIILQYKAFFPVLPRNKSCRHQLQKKQTHDILLCYVCSNSQYSQAF